MFSFMIEHSKQVVLAFMTGHILFDVDILKHSSLFWCFDYKCRLLGRRCEKEKNQKRTQARQNARLLSKSFF